MEGREVYVYEGEVVCLRDVFLCWAASFSPPLGREFSLLTPLRPYQREAATAAEEGGVVVLPCGSGKTLTGIEVIRRKRATTLICTVHSVSCLQWRDQILLHTDLGREDVAVVEEGTRWQDWVDHFPTVFISTYNMLTCSSNHSEPLLSSLRAVHGIPFQLTLCDEVHLAVASVFKKVITSSKGTVVGLTATLVREDSLLTHSSPFLGKVVYKAGVADLAKEGFVSNVVCKTLLMRRGGKKQEKTEEMAMAIRVLLSLLDTHRGEKIMLFCDSVSDMKVYFSSLRDLSAATLLGPLSMQSSKEERKECISAFKEARWTTCLVMAKVGDSALDVTSRVGIQVGSFSGSRMQEGQRVGRVQRPSSSNSSVWYSLLPDSERGVSFRDNRDDYLSSMGYKVEREVLDLEVDPILVGEVKARIPQPTHHNKREKQKRKRWKKRRLS